MRSIDSASGTAAAPNTIALLCPKSTAKLLKFDTTMSPPVDIMVIMTNISQKIGERSMAPGVAPLWSSRLERTSVESGSRSSRPATRPIAPRMKPNTSSVWRKPSALIIVSIGKVVASAPKP